MNTLGVFLILTWIIVGPAIAIGIALKIKWELEEDFQNLKKQFEKWTQKKY